MTTHSTRSNNQSGSTTVGFIFGLCAGLAIAAVVAFVIMRSPMPFVDKASNPLPTTAVTNQPNHDLNGSLSRNNEPAVAPAAPPMDLSEGDGDSKDKIDELSATTESALATTPSKPEKTTASPAETKPKSANKVYLQAGAFSSADDAEQQKAKLAMAGVSSQIESSEVNGKKIHRVRVGPFNDVDQAKQERKNLANNQIDATLVTNP